MTLADDFVDLAPGWLFDTHFAERGRFPRLVGLITNWYYNHTEQLTGLGVDDVTAMIIRNDSVYAYGTGAGNFFDIQNTVFDQNETMVVAENIKVTNILNGCTYDLSTGNIEGLTQVSSPAITEENHTYTLLLGGGIYSTYHSQMMETLVNECGNISDNVLFITGASSTNAAGLVNSVESASTGTVYEFEGIAANANSSELADAIAAASKFVFVDNEYDTFMDFMNNTASGYRLLLKMKDPASTSAFVGDNSRFVGASVINNYETAAASYYAELTFDPGLSLLETTVVMPKSFMNSDMYENSTTGVPYAMLQDGLTYGIWLNKKNYAKYFVDNDGVKLIPFGDSPVMIMKNEGTNYDFSVTGSTANHDPRMVAGFEEMTLNVLNSTKSFVMGTNPGVGISGYLKDSEFTVYPNPASNIVYCESEENSLLEIYSIDGKLLKRFGGQKRYEVNIADFDSGIYLFKSTVNSNSVIRKVTVQ
ncbi:MAG: hypothetical protein C0599_03775 [Salinivirgaceae bacterium]|nr:MAG: hypothetical protein C0599_03775 [Salinivirgaceae bacterium]